MKYLPALLGYFLQDRRTKKNIILLSKFFCFLAGIICLYSILFHVLMLFEGRDFSWVTGF